MLFANRYYLVDPDGFAARRNRLPSHLGRGGLTKPPDPSRLRAKQYMAVTSKLKAEITVPKSVSRKAGFKPGERVEFRVSDRTITIVPKLSPDEIQDEREIRDPKIREAIRKSHQQFLAGKSRPIEALFAERAASPPIRSRRKT
jgi:bifunctional DNA-binding transcriptional regulator/antitoxin component of YhaV-PrlF toxin-antitoxin module